MILSHSEFVESISKNRTSLMGIAMIMVLAFHLFSWVHVPLGYFNIGYVGVDLFLFLSGFGLYHSYNRNTIFRFYRSRIIRIYPLYIIGVLTTWLLFNTGWGFEGLINNITTVGYYVNGGGNRYDWYLESLFTLYAIFPLFYYISISKMRNIGLALILLAVIIVLSIYDVSWWHDCLISRIPIFIYGIMFPKYVKSYKITGALGLLLYVPCRYYVSEFLASSILTISIIYVSIYVLKYVNPIIESTLRYIGTHTLEIYIANLYVFWCFRTYALNSVERLAIFCIIQFAVSYVLITINKQLLCIKQL